MSEEKVQALARPLTWRGEATISVLWAVIVLPWALTAEDRPTPWLVFLVGALVLPTLWNLLRRRGLSTPDADEES